MSQNGITLPTSGTLAGLTAVQAINAAHQDLAGFFSGATAPAAPVAYQYWADTTSGYLKQRNGANTAWNTVAKLDQDAIAALQGQLYTAFTTGGTAPAFTLTPTPAIAAYAAGQRFRVKFNAAGTTGSNTLAVSGLGAVNLKQYDSAGNKVAAMVAANMLTDVEYDGTDMVVLDPIGGMTSGPNNTPFSFRNRIINGDMRIDQRNNGAVQTFTAGSVFYCVDRFYARSNGANVTGQRIAGTGADQFVYQFTGAASVSTIAFGQRIEATNIYDLAGSTATFSVELANSLLTTVTWTAYYPTAADNYTSTTQIATGTFTVNSTLSRYYAQIALSSNVQNGLCIELSVGAQTSGTWKIGQFQLEGGTVATPFERRPIGIELGLCQRYYVYTGANCFDARGYAATASDVIIFPIPFPVPMRATPTMAFGYSNVTNTASLIGSTTTAFATSIRITAVGAGQVEAIASYTASAEL